MVRVVQFFVALGVFACVGQAWAVGLGEIETQSGLNEKFVAHIQVLDSRGLQPTEIIVSLASSEDFRRVGVERFFFLTDLRFRIEARSGQDAVIRVTSSQPITEPFLNFLVEVLWPNGRLLKEFTVLLDPPTFSDQRAAAVTAPARVTPTQQTAGQVQRPTIQAAPAPVPPESQVRLTPSPTPSSAPLPEERHTGDTYGPTDRDDTLWSIAKRVRPANATIYQTMLALQRLNPEAFIANNVNLVKAGYVLRLPSEADSLAMTTRQAFAEVASQAQAWEEMRRRGPGAATQVADTAAGGPASVRGQLDATNAELDQSGASAAVDGELRILADDAMGVASSGAGAATVAALENQLAVSEEERDRITRENDELQYRLDRLGDDVAQSERQIEVRDQEIAQLQQRLAEITSAQAEAAAEPQSQQQSVGQTEPEQSIFAMLTSPLALGVGGFFLLLGLTLVYLKRRRQVADAYDFEATDFDDRVEPDVEAVATIGGDAAAEEYLVTESDFDQGDDDGDFRDAEPEVASADEASADETSGDEASGDEMSGDEADEADQVAAAGQTSDVIGEADIYIAYSRYPQAVALLQGALDEDPSRHDVRVKLLELFVETRDTDQFEVQMGALAQNCDDEDLLLQAREMQARLAEDALDADAQESTAADVDESADASDDTLDEFELELATDDDDAVADGAARVQTESDLEVETSADVGGVEPAEQAQAADSTSASDQLGGDLGLDFDPDTKETAVVEEAAKSDTEFNLDDLELEEEGEVSLAEVAVEEAQADEFDFESGDTAATKLDLARAYIDMGDNDGARDILSEVMTEGSDEQQQEAKALLEQLG